MIQHVTLDGVGNGEPSSENQYEGGDYFMPSLRMHLFKQQIFLRPPPYGVHEIGCIDALNSAYRLIPSPPFHPVLAGIQEAILLGVFGPLAFSLHGPDGDRPRL